MITANSPAQSGRVWLQPTTGVLAGLSPTGEYAWSRRRCRGHGVRALRGGADAADTRPDASPDGVPADHQRDFESDRAAERFGQRAVHDQRRDPDLRAGKRPSRPRMPLLPVAPSTCRRPARPMAPARCSSLRPTGAPGRRSSPYQSPTATTRRPAASTSPFPACARARPASSWPMSLAAGSC